MLVIYPHQHLPVPAGSVPSRIRFPFLGALRVPAFSSDAPRPRGGGFLLPTAPLLKSHLQGRTGGLCLLCGHLQTLERSFPQPAFVSRDPTATCLLSTAFHHPPDRSLARTHSWWPVTSGPGLSCRPWYCLFRALRAAALRHISTRSAPAPPRHWHLSQRVAQGWNSAALWGPQRPSERCSVLSLPSSPPPPPGRFNLRFSSSLSSFLLDSLLWVPARKGRVITRAQEVSVSHQMSHC